MTNPEQNDTPSGGAAQTEGGRPKDDRRGSVRPSENPVPRSPEPDEEALREGQEVLERVKPY